MVKVEAKREINRAFDRKVYETINYYRGIADNKFAKLLVLETANSVYWAKDNFKSKDRVDVAKYNGVKLGDMILVEANSSYGTSDFEGIGKEVGHRGMCQQFVVSVGEKQNAK